MSKLRSPYWQYFTAHDTNKKAAICNICKAQVSRGSDDPKKQTTVGLQRHLKNFHIIQYNAINDKPKKSIKSNFDSVPGPSTSDQNQPKIVSTKLKNVQERNHASQSTIPNWVESTNKLAFNSDKAQKIHKSIFEFMMIDLRPFSIVNDVGFLRMYQIVAPQFTVASEKYYRSLLVPTYEKVKNKLLDQLKADNPQSVSITLDGWSAHHHGYIGINGHYLTKDWQRKKFHIACAPFDKAHTAINIRGSVTRHCEE